MTKIMKCFLIVSLLLSCVTYSTQIDVHAENEPVDYDITFTENGLVVSSSDQGFLASIESIEMNQDNLSVEFTSSDWTIEDNELIIYGGIVYASGFKVRKEANVTVSASGYEGFSASVLLGLIRVKDVSMHFNSKGDIVINSSDDYFLQELGAPNDVSYIYFDNKTYTQQYTYLSNTKENNVYYYEDGKVVIPSDVLVNKQYHNGNTYTLTVQVASYTSHTLNEEITFKGGVYANPSVKFDDIGLRIYSEDLNYVDQITKIEIKTFTDSVVEFDTEDWTISEHTLTLAGNKILEHGLQRYTNYHVFVHAQDYAKVFKTLHFSSFSVVNAGGYLDELGNLVIESDDSYWLNSFVEGDGEIKIGDTYFRGSDFKKVNQQIMIQTDTLVAAGFNNGKTYEVRSYVKGYYDTVLGEVSFTGGAYTHPVVEYTRSGVFIYSSNQDYLNSVNSILVVVNVAGEGTYEGQLSSKDWVVTEGQIFIPGGKIWEAGEVQPSGASITGGLTIIAEGYAKVISNTYFNMLKVDDVSVEVDDEGNVRINSSDKYWLRLLYEKTSGYSLDFLIDSAIYASIYNSNQSGVFLFENGQLIVPAQTLINHGLFAGETYEITTTQFPGLYYYKEIGSVTLTKGIYKKPSDIKIKMNQEGDLIISSKDSAWLNAILQAKEKTGKSSVVLYHRKDGVKYTYEFYNDENQSDLTLTDEGIVIQSELLIQRGMFEGTYSCNLNAYLYEMYFNSINVQGLKCSLPEDVSIVQDDDGNLVVSSSDTIWLNGLLENRTDQFAVEALNENQEVISYFWNTKDVKDLVMENGSVVISADVVKMRGIYADSSYDLILKSSNYESLTIKDVYFRDGVVSIPDDLELFFDQDGNIVLSTSNIDYLEKLVETRRRSDFSAIMLIGESEYEFYNDANTTSLMLDENQVVLYRETMKSSGMTAGTYYMEIRAFGYETIAADVTIGLVKQAPEVSVSIDASGNIVIESEDDAWLNGLVSQRDEYAAVYVYDSDGNYVAYFWNVDGWTDLVKKDGKVIIDSDKQKLSELLSGETYDLSFYVADYEGVWAQVTLTHCSMVYPDDVEISQDDQRNLIIESNDSDYLEALEHSLSTLYVVSGDEIISISSNQIVVEDGRAVVSRSALVQQGVLDGTVEVHLYAHGYVTYVDETFDLSLVMEFTDEVAVSVDPQTGDVVISSDNATWIAGLNEGHIQFSGDGKKITLFAETNYQVNENSVVFDSKSQIKAFLSNDVEYTVTMNSKDYESVSVAGVVLTHAVSTDDYTLSLVENEQGDLIISSNHAGVIEALKESNLSQIALMNTHLSPVSQHFIHNHEWSFADGTIVIDSSVIDDRGILNDDHWQVMIEPFGFKSKTLNDVKLSHACGLPPVASAFFDHEVGVVIQSADQAYLNAMDRFTFSTEGLLFKVEEVIHQVENGRIVFGIRELAEYGLMPGEYVVSVFADGYGTQEIELSVSKIVPIETTLEVDQNSGDILIKSPHLLWQYGMIRDRGASYDEPAVHVSDEESYLTYFINNDDYHDLVMVDDVVVVSAQKQQEAGLLTGKSYDLIICSLGYESCLYYPGIVVTHGLTAAPTDVRVSEDASGNVVITSSNQSWLESLAQLGGYVQFSASEGTQNWWFYHVSCTVSDGKLTLSNETLKKNHMPNGDFELLLSVEGYQDVVLDVELTKCFTSAPSDISISFSEETGIVISSADLDYIASIESVEIVPENQEGMSYSYDELQSVRNETSYVIPLSALKEDGVEAGVYDVKVYAEGYGSYFKWLVLSGHTMNQAAKVISNGRETYYSSFSEAVENAKPGDTVELLVNTVLYEKLDVSGLSVELNDRVLELVGDGELVSESEQFAVVDFDVNFSVVFNNLSEKINDDGTLSRVVVVKLDGLMYSGIEGSMMNMEGYLFAGFFSDSSCALECGIRDIENYSGDFYAKFVTKDVFKIMAQNSVGIKDSSAGKMRLISTVDALTYSEVGFEIDIEGLSKNERKTSTVYSALVAKDGDKQIRYAPDMIAKESEYFMTMVIAGIPQSFHNAKFTIRAYWVTLDGTKVYGDSYVKIISQMPGYN